MMHRSKKLLVSGDREYFNEKRSVNVRVKGTAHLAESFGSCAETGFEEIEVRAHGPYRPYFLQPDWPVSRDFLLIKRIRWFARHSGDASFLTEHIARAFSRR